MSFDILEAADHLKKRVRENPPLPSWAYDEPDRAGIRADRDDNTWSDAELQARDRYEHDRRRLEDEPA